MDATITMSAAEITILTFSLSAMAFLISAVQTSISRYFRIFLLLASIFPITAAPWERDRDELGRVEILERVLEERATYKIFLIDSFEMNIPWKIFRGDSFLNQTEFISKTPSSPAWEKEKSLLSKYFPTSFDYSFMIHSFIENPGNERIEIQPNAPIYFPEGIPIRLFFWVYSENVDMTGKLILSQEKSKDLYIDLGSFKFEGWRRIEATIQLPAKNIRLVQSLQIPLKVKGIRFSSSSFQKKGPFFLYLDQMTVLLETSSSSYPGAEIKDNWGD